MTQPAPADPSAPLPAPVADGVERKLDPRYVLLERRTAWIGSAIIGLVLLAVAVLLVTLTELGAAARTPIFAVWFAVTAAVAWWGQRVPAIAYRHASYRVDADGIEIRGGVFWRNAVHVPRTRVQHTDVSQGPFERRYGLGTLSIFTAGVSHAMVSLHGLDHAVALRIRDTLLPRDGGDVV